MSTLLLLPGDGIGPEIAAQAERLIAFLNTRAGLGIEVLRDDVGGTAYDRYGSPCADHTLQTARTATAVLLGAVGGPQWDSLPYEHKPERGLLRLRKELDLFANLRPASCFDSLIDASTLRADVLRGTDLLIVRELTAGVYFSQPRGIFTEADGTRRGVDTQAYTEHEVRRVARAAFEAARIRRSHVTSCDKANVMYSGVLWREEVTRLHAAEYADVTLEHMYADNTAMQLVRNPRRFDVVVTDNLFGDILSDVAAMLTGSLGMLPSASLSTPGGPALYEPVHGSAPDIAGKNLANPCGMILSLAMALRHSFARADVALLIENAVRQVTAEGIRTADIAGGGASVGTDAMGAAIEAALETALTTA